MTLKRTAASLNLGTLPPPWDKILPLAVRVAVWLLIFALLFLLRSFSLLIFLTFVFAHIQAHGVQRLKPFIPNRPLRVVIVGLLVLAIMVGVISFLFPRFKDQAELFAGRYTDYLRAVDTEVIQLSQAYPTFGKIILDNKDVPHNFDARGQLLDWTPNNSLSAQLLGQIFSSEGHGPAASNLQFIDTVRKVTTSILATGSAFLLSLLFSFLIVLDLPKLTRSVASLADSKIAFMYHEVAGNIKNFGRVLGSALEAQLFIAIINTILTAIGIYFLGIEGKVAFLSLIVFICSFIPVAGVVISSIPICLLALQDGGVVLVIFAVLLIWIIHIIEAYVLNPRIYGHHLRINPVLVLIILTIGGKLFGVWGLVLGLPVCTYIFQHAIRYKPEDLLPETVQNVSPLD